MKKTNHSTFEYHVYINKDNFYEAWILNRSNKEGWEKCGTFQNIEDALEEGLGVHEFDEFNAVAQLAKLVREAKWGSQIVSTMQEHHGDEAKVVVSYEQSYRDAGYDTDLGYPEMLSTWPHGEDE